jgi:hypothetical protein
LIALVRELEMVEGVEKVKFGKAEFFKLKLEVATSHLWGITSHLLVSWRMTSDMSSLSSEDVNILLNGYSSFISQF